MEITKTQALDKISDFIKPYIGNLFPGCIIGCANNTQQFTYAAGTQDGFFPMVDSNIFDVASVTKSILHAVALKNIPLSELDQRVTDVFPLKGKYRDQITVRHLLTFGVEYGDKIPLSKITERGELIYMLESGDLVVPPGTSYRYTNISSMILSIFLQRKFGKNFGVLVQEQLLDPLEMYNTTFDPLLLDPTALSIVPIQKGIDRGVIQDESARLYDGPIGSAGLFSTMKDLLLFGQSFLGENSYLPKEIITAMPISQFSNTAMSFGLGMGLRHQNECDLCNEDGSPIVVLKKNGFSGVHFCVLPENDFCFVVFGNICYPHRPTAEKRDQFTLFHKRLLRLLYEHRNELL